MAVSIRRLAVKDGWEVSDLMRTLLVLSAVGSWLGLRKEENRGRLMELAELRKTSIVIQRAIHGSGPKRPYAARGGGETEVLTLILPANLSALVELHANAAGLSKNEMCQNLVTKGLIIYLRGEKALIETLRSLASVRADEPSECSTRVLHSTS